MAEPIFDVPLQERLAVSTGVRWCFLSSTQASPRGTLFPHVALLLIYYWLCVQSSFVCFILCLSSALHSNDEERLIQLCPEAVIFLRWTLGKCTTRECHTPTGEKVIFHTACLHSGYFLKQICNESKMKGGPEWVFCFMTSLWCVCLMKQRWKAQSIPSAHIFIHWHRGSAKQRLRGRGLWNDNAHSGSSRQRHALLSARNVLTNRARPQRQPPLLLYFFCQ